MCEHTARKSIFNDSTVYGAEIATLHGHTLEEIFSSPFVQRLFCLPSSKRVDVEICNAKSHPIRLLHVKIFVIHVVELWLDLVIISMNTIKNTTSNKVFIY